MLHDGQEAVLAIGEVLVLVGVEPIRNGSCFIFRDALVEFDVQVPDSRRPEQILDRWIFRGAKIILASVHLGVGSGNNAEEGIEMLAAQGGVPQLFLLERWPEVRSAGDNYPRVLSHGKEA